MALARPSYAVEHAALLGNCSPINGYNFVAWVKTLKAAYHGIVLGLLVCGDNERLAHAHEIDVFAHSRCVAGILVRVVGQQDAVEAGAA